MDDLELELNPIKSPDTEIDTPPQIHTQTINGPTKNHHPPPPVVLVAYKECMKNHAAAIGGYAVDGCGEYMPSHTLLKCAACGCHRNFHRREPEYSSPTAIIPPFLDFRHPPQHKRSSSPSPSLPRPPPSFPCAPHTLLALSTSVAAEESHQDPATPTVENPAGRKRFRTRFSQEQKQKMHSFSEKIGWKMQRSDEAEVEEFCQEIGVSRGVLKVWMHNNKNTFARKDIINGQLMSSLENNNGSDSKNEEIRKIENGSHFQNHLIMGVSHSQ